MNVRFFLAEKYLSKSNIQLTLNNGINRTALLAVSTVDALGHVDVVSGRATASVLTLLSLNGNSLGRANGLAELASNAPLFTGRIATQGVFATEARRDGALLEGIVDRVSVSAVRLTTPQLELPLQTPIDRVVVRIEWKTGGTYGGLKNCSNTTYMPRIISVSRKYFPALSMTDSSP